MPHPLLDPVPDDLADDSTFPAPRPPWPPRPPASYDATRRRHRRPPRALAWTLVAMKAAGLGVLVAVLALAGLGLLGAPTSASGPVAGAAPAAQPAAQPVDPVLERLMSDQQCSSQGLGAGEIPGSAIVRTPAGRVRLVSFDRGWAVQEGRAAGSLVAVCRVALPAR